ncbi:hypothetical protein PL10110_670051 [Planktothrix agardhii]|nr:hypothetical protein PL10110_670051 [Planktothrix agardhii]
MPKTRGFFGFIRKMGLKPRRSTTAFYSIVVYTEQEDFKHKE